MRHLTTLLLILAACLLTGADWRQFRGTDTTNVSQDKIGLPQSIDAKGSAKQPWKVLLPGRGPSGPIVVGNRVLVTAASGATEDRLHVVCFDTSGRQLWHRQLWATGSVVFNPFGGIASPTPASDGKRVFALFSSCDLVCFDLDGNLQWYRGLGQESPTTRNDVGMGSSPLVVGGTLVVQLQNQGESFVVGLDAATGRTRWRIEREHEALWSSPTLLRGDRPGEDRVLLQGRKELSAHDPETGRQVWAHPAPVDTIASVTTCGRDIYLPAVGLQALRIDTATGRPVQRWYQQRFRLDNPSPVAAGDRVYLVKPPGILVCCRTADGEPIWQLRLKGPIWATPVLADGHLYIVNHEGLVQIVKAGDEGKLVATSQIDPGVLASPAVADGKIYFRSDRHLWIFGYGK